MKEQDIQDSSVLSDDDIALFVNLVNTNSKKLNEQVELVGRRIIANSFDLFHKRIKIELISQLSDDNASEIISYLDVNNVDFILKSIDSDKIKSIIDDMHKEDIISVLEDLDDSKVEKILKNANANVRRQVEKQIGYGEGTAGYEMSPDFIILDIEQTVEEAIEQISKNKELLKEHPVVYVRDEDKLVIGYITLKRLIVADRKKKIESFVHMNVITVSLETDIEEVSIKMNDFDLNCIAVINKKGVMQGLISNDEIIDVIVDEATEDIHKLSAIGELNRPYLKSSTFVLVKSRIFWLFILIAFASVSEIMIHNFGDSIIMLIPLIPLIVGSAGNSGGQSSATIVRAIAINEVKPRNYKKVFGKELVISIIIAIIVGGANIARMQFASQSDIGFNNIVIVSIGLGLTIIMANILGSMLPLFATKIKLDPATMAGPIVTTIIDILGLFIVITFYLKFAT